jgi:hypothetical protein
VIILASTIEERNFIKNYKKELDNIVRLSNQIIGYHRQMIDGKVAVLFFVANAADNARVIEDMAKALAGLAQREGLDMKRKV